MVTTNISYLFSFFKTFRMFWLCNVHDLHTLNTLILSSKHFELTLKKLIKNKISLNFKLISGVLGANHAKRRISESLWKILFGIYSPLFSTDQNFFSKVRWIGRRGNIDAILYNNFINLSTNSKVFDQPYISTRTNDFLEVRFLKLPHSMHKKSVFLFPSSMHVLSANTWSRHSSII